MAIHIKSFNIDGFRGIKNLKVDRLNHINLIAGDNNSGKTSVLESLMLFNNPTDVVTLFNVARLRDNNPFKSSTSIFESFLNLFAKDQQNFHIDTTAVYREFMVNCAITGTLKKIMIDPTEFDNRLLGRNNVYLKEKSIEQLSNVSAFSGKLISEINGNQNIEKIEINEYTSASFLPKKISKLPTVVYLSPMSHLLNDNFDVIIKNEDYKKICIQILKMFDFNITDLLLLRGENSNTVIEYIKHDKLGNMPLSTYGDGIKKVISLANAIAKSAGGILLIDEVETAIHQKYYKDIFSFITKAAIQFKVQVFITTHSIETIDSFLNAQNYDTQPSTDNISVITFKKESNQTFSRVLTGEQTYKNRENFDFEVRI